MSIDTVCKDSKPKINVRLAKVSGATRCRYQKPDLPKLIAPTYEDILEESYQYFKNYKIKCQ
ncbi:hypothetical protein KY332_01600 [Candidatus Woesearchaeota archaeon]|nr:hypothetical protein [Candidatus Woesearchaeota archaeon]